MLMTFCYIWVGRAGGGREQRWKPGQDTVVRQRHACTQLGSNANKQRVNKIEMERVVLCACVCVCVFVCVIGEGAVHSRKSERIC